MIAQHIPQPRPLPARLGGIALLALAALTALAPLPRAAGADPFVVYGQVFPVDPEAAADESIADADLPLGEPMPYVRVKVVDATTDATLGTPVFAGATGNFTASFNAPPGSAVTVQVFRVVEGEAERIPAAREGINTFTLISPATGAAVRVASDERLFLGGAAGSLPYSSVGIVFTRVGQVEIPYISQDLTRPDKGRIGLADLSGDLVRADELNLPDGASAAGHYAVFKDAPFGGRLHLFGAFGQLSGIPPCIGVVDWYRVKIRPVTFDVAGNPVYGSSSIRSDLLRKMRFEIDYFPSLHADAFLEQVGPYSGTELTSSGPVPLSSLYRVNPFPTSPTQTVIYSFPDMRLNWVTSGLSGLYEVSLEYFRQTGGTATAPDLVRIPDTCFSGTLPPADAAKVALHKLLVRLDNTPLTSGFSGIYIKSAAGAYFAGAGNPRTGKAGAFDFLAPANLCEIMELDSSLGDLVEIDFRARQDDGYLRSYRLSATSNAGATVLFAEDSYDNHAAAGPLWDGLGTSASPVTSATNLVPFPNRCAYIFDLVVRSRVQNGYGYLQHHHHRKTYFVIP